MADFEAFRKLMIDSVKDEDVFAEDNVPGDLTENEKNHARLLTALIKLWIEKFGCGDSTPCGTCEVGVAIGLKILDDAFNAGYKACKEIESKRVQVREGKE